MKYTSTILPALAFGILTPLAIAGPESTPVASSSGGDWCKTLSDIGKIYSDKSNPYIQSFSLEGRLQYQMMHIDGNDSNGDNFSETADEYRRARLGAKVDFLQYFSAKAVVDIVSDSRPSGDGLDWGYQNFDTATLTFDIKKAFSIGALDKLNVTYGRHKFEMSAEAVESSNNIITIERSALSNKVYASGRPTGLSIQAGKGDWMLTTAIYSAAAQEEFINGGFNDGIAYFGAIDYTGLDKLKLRWDFVYNDADDIQNDSELGYEWATTFNTIYEEGPFGILGTVALGDNGENTNANREGTFYGFTVMPWYWIVEKKLQGVFQYSFAGSDEAQGIRTNSRYLRNGATGGVIGGADGRGDELHTFYTGLNYYLCGNSAKIMGGIEYADLNGPSGNVDALTYLLGFRMKF
jgi:hypothetical protein